MVIELIYAVAIPALGVNPTLIWAVLPRPTICGLNVPNGSAARESLLLWIVNWPYCSNATVDPKPTGFWCMIMLNSLYSTVPSLVATETIILADLGLYNSSLLAVPNPVLNTPPSVDAVPTVAMITSTSSPAWEDPANVVAAPMWTSAVVPIPGLERFTMEVDKPTICVVPLPTSSLRLYESVVTL